MTTSDWLIAGIRVLVIVSMIAGARRAWRARREAGFKTSVAGTVVTSIALLFYLGGAVLLFTSYGIWTYPRHLLLFATGAVLYLAGGIWVIAKVAGAFEKRATQQRSDVPAS